MKKQGFTLVELLVVIAVIAVLAGALLIAINPQAIIQKGRDSKRMQEVDTLFKAINLALADGEITLTDTSSCTTCDSASGTSAVDGTGWVPFTIVTGKTGLAKFVPRLPVDPLNTTSGGVTYVYSYGATVTNFEINAVMEHADNLTKMTTDGGNNDAAYEVGTSLSILN